MGTLVGIGRHQVREEADDSLRSSEAATGRRPGKSCCALCRPRIQSRRVGGQPGGRRRRGRTHGLRMVWRPISVKARGRIPASCPASCRQRAWSSPAGSPQACRRSSSSSAPSPCRCQWSRRAGTGLDCSRSSAPARRRRIYAATSTTWPRRSTSSPAPTANGHGFGRSVAPLPLAVAKAEPGVTNPLPACRVPRSGRDHVTPFRPRLRATSPRRRTRCRLDPRPWPVSSRARRRLLRRGRLVAPRYAGRMA